MEKVFNNIAVITNDEGYLESFDQWTPELAEEIAKEEGIELTEKHWEVIHWIQEQIKNEVALTIRGIKKTGPVDIKTFYALFPKGPLKVSTKIAGVPKPKSCI